ncbi:MAG TPA: pilus assembly protein PilP [Rhodanobacteraceae bacterium]|nr:pilus assembly protein PilP [Rhodanobacteraceae bacterium]
MQAKYLRLLLILLALGAMAGCTKGTADLHQWVAKQKAKKGVPMPPLPVIKTFETFIYKDQDKRDPFSVPVSDQQKKNIANGPHPDQNRPRQPLEAFALDSLKMVGSIGTGKGMVALIQDPNKKITRVHVNQYMGQNYGRVIDIQGNHVDLVELVPNGNGGWMERKASIALSTQ